MPLYHVVLFKLKDDADSGIVEEWQLEARAMVKKVPGLLDLQAGTPMEKTASLANGYEMSVVALLANVESMALLSAHPDHQKLNELFQEICKPQSMVIYDLEF